MFCKGIALSVIVLVIGCRQSEPMFEAPTASVVKSSSTQRPVPIEALQWPDPKPSPPLGGAGDAARQSVEAFVSWALECKVSQKPAARAALAAVRTNRDIARALFLEARELRRKDFGRALISLALLGEMRSPHSYEYLMKYLRLPRGRENVPIGQIDGDTTTAFDPVSLQDAQLAIQAIDGLAYQRTRQAYARVLQMVHDAKTHLERMEAADAYIWNHGDAEAARRDVDKYVRPDEAYIRDRFRRYNTDNKQAFDAKLDKFMSKHPDLIAPPLKPSTDPPKDYSHPAVKPRPRRSDHEGSSPNPRATDRR